MDFINCPFEDIDCNNISPCIVFDTSTTVHAKEVAPVIKYLAKNSDKKETNIINNIIKSNVGEYNFNIFKSQYIDTYNNDKNIIKNYAYLFNEKDVYGIIDCFNIIFELKPLLSEIVTYYS